MRRAMTAALLLVTAAVNSAHAQGPPMQDMLLWVKADAGVISDAAGVGVWEDQSGNGNNAIRAVGTMQRTTASFGKGLHDVIRFNKDGYFTLNTAPLRVPDVTVYAVVEQTGAERRAYFSTYSNAINWGYGYHLDMEGGSSRAFSSAGTSGSLSDWVVPGPSNGMHQITAAIGSTNGSKSIWSDSVLLGGPEPVPAMSYFAAETASIGSLGQLPIEHFYFRGDIAEILVYSSVSGAQRMAVESYLNNKYFVPEPQSVALLAVGAMAGFGGLRERKRPAK